MIFLEIFFDLLIIGLVTSTGVFVRWNFVAVAQLANGSQVMSLRKYYKKMTRDRDPSNQMSDGIIHWLLGAGTWFGVVFLLSAIL